MKEEEALKKIQIALENDTEVTLYNIEHCQGVLDQASRQFQGMIKFTESLDQQAEQYNSVKQEVKKKLDKIGQLDKIVTRYESLAREIEEYTYELDVKTMRLMS